MYAVAQAIITIPGSVQRLLKQGYCQNILMQDVWKLVVPESDARIQELQSQQTNVDPIPIVFATRIIDEVQQ